MPKEIKISGEFPNERFQVGNIVYSCAGDQVIVTKDTPSGIISIACHNYEGKGEKEKGQKTSTPSQDWEVAANAAWRMATMQTKC